MKGVVDLLNLRVYEGGDAAGHGRVTAATQLAPCLHLPDTTDAYPRRRGYGVRDGNTGQAKTNTWFAWCRMRLPGFPFPPAQQETARSARWAQWCICRSSFRFCPSSFRFSSLHPYPSTVCATVTALSFVHNNSAQRTCWRAVRERGGVCGSSASSPATSDAKLIIAPCVCTHAGVGAWVFLHG